MTITPKQFNQLVTKKEFQELKGEVKGIKQDTQKILISVDGLAKRFDVIETESKADKLAHNRMQKDIDNLELKVFP